MITLYQFEFSHFCEKARWALDHKGLAHVRKNLLPGLHMRVAKKLAPKSCLPILVDDGTVVQNSASIITYLDAKYPDRPLTPSDAHEAEEALAWEQYLDDEIGVPVRLWFYYHALPDRDRALRFLLDGAPWYGRPLFALIYPKVRAAMTALMDIHAESASQSEQRLVAAMDKLDDALKGRRFLVGDRFSRADLTACALLRRHCAVAGASGKIEPAAPAAVLALRDAHKARPFVSWVRQIYRSHRQPELHSAPADWAQRNSADYRRPAGIAASATLRSPMASPTETNTNPITRPTQKP
jgi:glutathione S-transferase